MHGSILLFDKMCHVILPLRTWQPFMMYLPIGWVFFEYDLSTMYLGRFFHIPNICSLGGVASANEFNK